MASSSLITSIHSALLRIDSTTHARDTFIGREDHFDKSLLKIGLRSLKGLVLCLRNFGDDAEHLEPRSLMGILLWFMKLRSLAALFWRIGDAIASRSLETDFLARSVFASEIHVLVKEVEDALSNRMIQSSIPMTLTVDVVVGITDSILENTADILARIRRFHWRYNRVESPSVFEVIEAFEVHIRFMKNFLLFAMWVGPVEFQDLLFHIQPIAIIAVGVFLKNGNGDEYEWCRNVESKCLAVNQMAIDHQIYQAYRQTLRYLIIVRPVQEAPMYDHLLWNFLDSLISVFWDFLRHSDYRNEEQFIALYESLHFSRDVLKEFVGDEIIRYRIEVLICDAGELICSFPQTDPANLLNLLQTFKVLLQEIEQGDADSTTNEDSDGSLLRFASADSDGSEKDDLPEEIPPTPQSDISQAVGFHDGEVTSVLDRLTRGSNHLRIVPICGMAGLGKTTFALKLYNHHSVIHHFHKRAWCPISQVMDKKKVLLQLLNQIHDSGSYNREMALYDLADSLRKNLKGKRYLIMLDDVWTPQVWNDLKEAFPDDSTGSRIILTSRRLDIAPHALPDEQPHFLRLRMASECLQILQMKLSHKEGWTPELGMEFAKECKGLPLTVVIVAGLLATMEQLGWEGILDDLRFDVVSSAESVLELSYKHLPYYLQPCFLYCGAFPEDKEIPVKRLIRLWMAEGFIRKNELKRMEDVAREYLEELIERSLVMVARNRSVGGVSSCRIHDLLLDFCLKKVKEEDFSHMLVLHDEFPSHHYPCNMQRLSIYYFNMHLKDLRLFSESAVSLVIFHHGDKWSRASSLFDMTFIIQTFPLLNVLDIHEITLITGVPFEIELLTHLRYFSFCTTVPAIPSSVGNLSHLETFIADFDSCVVTSFPFTLWSLNKMKYLHIQCRGDGFTLPSENHESSSSILLELETLHGVVFYSDGSMEKQMRKFPNIRRLKCLILHGEDSTEESTEEHYKMVVPNFLSQLESLTVRGTRGKCKYEFGSSLENLKKLRLDGFYLSKENIAVIGKIPNLVVLKLFDIQFSANILEMEEDEFLKLRFLKVGDCHYLEGWTASDYQLPCLQKLVFRLCTELKELPSCLETSSTLDEVQVLGCSSTLESLVRDIEMVQNDYGNLIKVHISSW